MAKASGEEVVGPEEATTGSEGEEAPTGPVEAAASGRGRYPHGFPRHAPSLLALLFLSVSLDVNLTLLLIY